MVAMGLNVKIEANTGPSRIRYLVAIEIGLSCYGKFSSADKKIQPHQSATLTQVKNEKSPGNELVKILN